MGPTFRLVISKSAGPRQSAVEPPPPQGNENMRISHFFLQHHPQSNIKVMKITDMAPT